MQGVGSVTMDRIPVWKDINQRKPIKVHLRQEHRASSRQTFSSHDSQKKWIQRAAYHHHHHHLHQLRLQSPAPALRYRRPRANEPSTAPYRHDSSSAIGCWPIASLRAHYPPIQQNATTCATGFSTSPKVNISYPVTQK